MPKIIDDAWVAIDGMKYLLFITNFLIWVSTVLTQNECRFRCPNETIDFETRVWEQVFLQSRFGFEETLDFGSLFKP